MNVLAAKVCYQKDTWSSLSKQMTIEEVLKEITGEVYKREIEKLRGLILTEDKESYKAEKLKLPAIKFCGIFHQATEKENLNEYNRIVPNKCKNTITHNPGASVRLCRLRIE